MAIFAANKMGPEAISNPSIYIGAFELREPITTLTDLVFAGVGWYAFARFYRHKGEKTEAFRFFYFYFFFFGFGITCASLLGHAFQAYLTPDYKAIGWSITSFGIMSIELASLNLISNMIKRTYKYIFRTFIVMHIIAFLALMMFDETRDFRFSAANSVIGLVLVSMSMQIFHGVKMKSKGSWLLVAAILFGFSPLFVYIFKFSISNWFNYHDLSHLLLATSMYIMYLGAWRLGTKPSSV